MYMEKIRVLLLMGGRSAEREVSLQTGEQIMNVVSDVKNIEIIPVDISKGGQWLLASSIDEFSRGSILELSNFSRDKSLKVTSPLSKGSLRIDCAFIALHGQDGEDGKIQGFLESMGVPYSGSGILASALAMDKEKSNKYFSSCGFLTPNILKVLELNDAVPESINFPVIVMPNNSGSSVGVSKCSNAAELNKSIKEAFNYSNKVLITEFISGQEYSCGVIDYGGKVEALPVIGIEPNLGEIYNYESKYQINGSKHTIPAQLDSQLAQELQRIAMHAHIELGCRDISRSDFIISHNQIYLLEVNTIPGMTQTSLIPQSAQVAGITLKDMIIGIIEKTFSREITKND